MSKIVMDVSMSLDGYSAGPNVRGEEPMGDGGERLHGWTTGSDGAAVHQEWNAAVGASLIGRRTFEVGQRQWGGTPWPRLPCFVVTHRRWRGDPPALPRLEGVIRRT
jgi:dihydrofolate reductase